MVKLRLKRTGKKKYPCYQIVAIDSRRKRDASFIEKIGHFYPIADKYDLNKEKALKWLHLGAQPTLKIRSFLKKENIMKLFHEQKKQKNTLKNDVK